MFTRWLPWKFIVKRTAKAYGIIDPVSFMARLRRFAQPSEVQEPIELLRAGIVFHARGLINTKAIQHNLDWIWPYWVERQFNPADQSFIPRAFSFSHVNLTHRNWTAVGNPDLARYPLVDPRGLITPFFDGWSLDFWIVDDSGSGLVPSQNSGCSQRLELDPDLRVTTRIEHGRDRLSTTVWVDCEGAEPRLRVAVRGGSGDRKWLVLSVRPYNPEGVQFVERIDYDREAGALRVNSGTPVLLAEAPDRVVFSSYEKGDVSQRLGESQNQSQVSCKVGMATAAAAFELDRTSRDLEVSVPLRAEGREPSRAAAGRARTWQEALGGTARLDVPDERIKFLYDSAVRTMLLLSAEDVVPGPYTYKRFWFRDACFMINALLAMNQTERSRRLLDTFPERQKVSGYFLSQQGEWDSNGEALWIMRRYLRLTGREPGERWLRSVRKGARWLRWKRSARSAKGPHAGLLPAGFSAEHLGPNDYYYWDNFWGIAGLRAASEILEQAGETGDADKLKEAAESFEAVVMQSIDSIPDSRKRGGIPAAPSRRMDAGAVGSMVADYPLQLFGPGDERIVNTADFLMQRCFFRGGFFQDMIHSGINAYLTLDIAQTLLRSGDERYRELVDTVAGLASETGQWPEAIHPITGGGCMGDGQHGWAAAEWVMMLRNMFVREEPGSLILGSGVLPEWLNAAGARASFGPTPTPYGPVGVSLRREDSGLRVDVQAPEGAEHEAAFLVRVPGFEEKTIANCAQPVFLSSARP
jgi:hypothetical protein